MSTIKEIALEAKQALASAQLVIENAVKEIDNILEPFLDIPEGITVSGVAELRSIKLNLQNQVGLITSSSMVFMSAEERMNAAPTMPMITPPMMA